MILCITEKPSVAKDIAAILGANVKKDGYYEGGAQCRYKVTWTFGHLCTLKEPHDYQGTWKRWKIDDLPIIPPKFGIKLIPQKTYEKQFRTIERLIRQADEVINCGDAGQEGELIQRWVMQKAKTTCPVKRLWISSLTDEAIKKGFKDLRPGSEFDNLYYAGMARAMGDWLLGMNATRLYSTKYSVPGRPLSIGRVQTPTLALIVQRYREIKNFRPEDYWEIRTIYRDVPFNATTGKFDNEAKAKELLDKIASLPFVVKAVDEKKGTEAPPKLFDLTSLQVECNKKWGWSADQTLGLIQKLYEKKVTTYPRVDTTYLSEDLHPKIPQILRAMTPYATLTEKILNAPIPKTKRIFDNAKVTDHHAIIPTGQLPTSLVGDEKILYHLIARRFIAAFYHDCKFTATTVTGQVGNITFKANGKVIDDPGWKVIYANDKVKEEQEQNPEECGDSILPKFTIGEQGPHKPQVIKKTTQPPKPYTEGTLLRAMESAGKTVDDEALREAMKENGIGRPSTRASIIETLFNRKYIVRERKNILPTKAGLDLIDLIQEDLLKSAKLTGIWENKLRKIERGQYSTKEFIDELKQMVTKVVNTVKADTTDRQIFNGKDQPKAGKRAKTTKSRASAKSTYTYNPKIKTPSTKSVPQSIPCPICGQGHIIKGRTAYGCSRYAHGCQLRLPFSDYPETMTIAQLEARLKSR